MTPAQQQRLRALAVELIRYGRPSRRSIDHTTYLGELVLRGVDDDVEADLVFLVGVLAGYAGDLVDQVEKLTPFSGDDLLDEMDADLTFEDEAGDRA